MRNIGIRGGGGKVPGEGSNKSEGKHRTETHTHESPRSVSTNQPRWAGGTRRKPRSRGTALTL